MSKITRGFRRRGPAPPTDTTLPPGQHLVDGFPVLSAGPTPRTPLEAWDLTVDGAVDASRTWDWDAYRALPAERIERDIHCVTSWSKLGTHWEGVAIDTLLDGLDVQGGYVLVACDGGYTTNLRLDDLTGGKAWVVHAYEDAPITPEHGGPARLLVPHLYFWKSAKWIRRITVTPGNEPGFWESFGYHDRGDPWLEQRYSGD